MVKQHYIGVSLNLTVNCLKINKINIMIASRRGHKGTVKLLIDANADLNIQEKDGSTAWVSLNLIDNCLKINKINLFIAS